MSITLEFDDKTIQESVEGRFLIGVGQAIADLGIEPLNQIRIDAYPVVNFKKRPAIIVSPRPELFNVEEQIGRYEIRYAATVALCSDSQELRREALGWHLKARGAILRAFSGQETESAALVVNGDCFELAVEPGIRFDPRARAKNWLLGYMTVTGIHTSDPQ